MDWDAVGKIKLKCGRKSWVAFSTLLLQPPFMSDLSYRLAELRPLLRPVAEYAAWPAAFLIATVLSQEPVYFLALLLVVATDLIDASNKSKGLFRDSVAGTMTTLLALTLNDHLGLALGAIVAVVAIVRLLQKPS